jgi:hypothetical protein
MIVTVRTVMNRGKQIHTIIYSHIPHHNTLLQVSSRLNPVDLVFRGFEVVQLHVYSILSMLVNHDGGNPNTDQRSNEMISESELGVVVGQDTLTERVPGALPGNRILLSNLCISSVGLGNSRSVDLEGFRELVKHLLVLLIIHLTVYEHISVGFQIRSVITQLLQERIVLRGHVESVLNRLTDLRRNMSGYTEFVSGDFGVVVLLRVWIKVTIPGSVVECRGARQSGPSEGPESTSSVLNGEQSRTRRQLLRSNRSRYSRKHTEIPSGKKR